ncbi:MAG: hypothetical protein K0R92_366 [Lachnospiraceae bacterium]|jgi:hypothetical protein|nr:hypothetical protein [Lachnospiraceae bacterium]
MSNIKDLMEGRNQGMAFALKIARKGGIEALEKEIKYRNISGVSLNLTQKDIREASKLVSIRATEVAIAISLVTLMDEFKMSRTQLHKFKAAFDELVYKAANSDQSIDNLKELTNRIFEDTGIEISIKG